MTVVDEALNLLAIDDLVKYEMQQMIKRPSVFNGIPALSVILSFTTINIYQHQLLCKDAEGIDVIEREIRKELMGEIE